MKNTEQHLVWVDITRIVAVVLVVLLHTFTISNVQSLGIQFSLYLMVLAKISVPLFVMISGALLLSKQEPWRDFYRKRLHRVLIPWMIWSVIIVLLKNGAFLGEPFFLLTELKRTFIAEFTFLPLIFCLYLLIPPLQIITKYGGISLVAYTLCLWFVAISVLPFFHNSLAFPLSIDNGLVTQTIRFSGYLLAGWLLTKVSLTKKTAWFAIVTGVVITTLWSTWLVQSEETLDFTFSSYLSPWIIMASMGVFVIISNLEHYFKLFSSRQKSVLKILGRGSFGVFLIHNSVKQLLLPMISDTLSTGSYNVLLWMVVTVISFGMIVMLSRINKVGKYLT